MFTSEKEDKTLLSRAEDILNTSRLRHKPCFFGFLNEREQYLIGNYLGYARDEIRFFGGYPDSSRKIMCAYEYDVADDEYPIKKLCYKFRTEDKLSHRDFLGSLMGLGIERSCVGDILVGDGSAAVFVKEEICDYVRSQLTKIGRAGIKPAEPDECNLRFEQAFDSLNLIVSSLRLDAVVAALTKLSRSKAVSLIISGKVFVNYCESQNVSQFLKPDDILTIRGKGKFVIKEQSSSTKKGRLKILINHYR